jgi:hypothetical protein
VLHHAPKRMVIALNHMMALMTIVTNVVYNYYYFENSMKK